MAGSMKDIKLRIKSVESTMQITKAMELVASSKMRRAKERVEHSRPYFETLHETLTKIAAADPRARNPYLRRDEVKRTLLIVIAGDRGLAGGYNSNVLKQAGAEEGEVLVLPIGKRSAEYFVHHEVPLFTQEVLLAADVSVGECFQLSRQITEGYLKGEYDAVKICYTRFDSMMTQTAATMEVLPLSIEPTEQQKADARRSQIYNALFEIRDGKPQRLCQDRAISLAELGAELKKMQKSVFLVGDGAQLCYNTCLDMGIPAVLAPGNLVVQSAWGVAMAAFGQTPAPAEELLPVYLRLSQAERERQARLAAEAEKD